MYIHFVLGFLSCIYISWEGMSIEKIRCIWRRKLLVIFGNLQTLQMQHNCSL